MALTEKLTAIGNAIREKTGKEELLTLDDMAAEIRGISAGGDGDNELLKSILNRSISGDFNNTDIETLGYYSLYRCYELTSVNLPNVKVAQQYALAECSNLVSARLDNLDTYSAAAYQPSYLFANCSKLTDVWIPNLTGLTLYTFRNCVALEFLDLPKVKKIARSFDGCSSLKTIVLRVNQVVNLDNNAAFVGTPFASGGNGGVVYVPQSLITAYQTATNWSALYEGGTCEFRAIEGSEYE